MDDDWLSRCDELQCTSTSAFGELYPWCWANLNATENDFLCSDDGYIGFALESVTPIVSEDGNLLQYYTCCPADNNIFENANATVPTTPTHQPLHADVLPQCEPTRDACNDYCGDCLADAINEPMSCKDEDGIYIHPRRTMAPKQTYNSWQYSQYRCCRQDNLKEPETHTIMMPETIRFVLGAIASFLALSLILGIMTHRRVRNLAFNLYLLFLVVPDLLINFIATLVSGYVIFKKESFPDECIIHFFPTSFWGISNYWLNVCILHEIHRLLRASKARRRCHPPTVRKVLIQSAGVFVFAGILSYLWVYLHCIKIPDPEERVEYWETSTEYKILSLIVFLCNSIIPFFYLLGVMIHIKRAKLIPRTGRTRVLAFYFYRIVVFFMIGTLIIMPLLLSLPHNVIMGAPYIARYLGSTITIVNVLVSISKPDIRQSVFHIWKCRNIGVTETSWIGVGLNSSFLKPSEQFKIAIDNARRSRSRKGSSSSSGGFNGQEFSPGDQSSLSLGHVIDSSSSMGGGGNGSNKSSDVEEDGEGSGNEKSSNDKSDVEDLKATRKTVTYEGDFSARMELSESDESGKEVDMQERRNHEDHNSPLFFDTLPEDSIWNQLDQYGDNEETIHA